MSEAKLARRGTVIPEGRVKRLHVNQHSVKAGRPAITIQMSNGPQRCSEVLIRGTSYLVHRPEKPLSCGARVWIETMAEVEVVR